jgi:hypothetical protein
MTWISPIYGCDYKSKMDKILFYGESNMVSKHLARLADMGGIILQDDAFMKKA